jgi:hypothetical protein
MRTANECLEAGDLARVERNDRLRVEHQRVIREGASEPDLQLHPLERCLLLRAGEEAML